MFRSGHSLVEAEVSLTVSGKAEINQNQYLSTRQPEGSSLGGEEGGAYRVEFLLGGPLR